METSRPPHARLTESIIIARIADVFRGVGLPASYTDDCAHLDVDTHLVSTDTLVQDVHFDLRWDTPYQVGRQAAVQSE